ncbi:putative Fe-S oxidoreductase [Paludibacter propionicigenes WB4]|uniref:Putative Fe-S oxidoreductase n=1 Tax=Paludibacter propionicigenes (strain DSM 17365 / JCM 13257 / WB4) TaxID=694427 RepID=E4T6M8_PALPW|nr:radical SAM protein [Paludibacter propionicigenes]ADQ80372.1 putative Fe-S oxidoreductase [Paludibacter propionicigenes WB4]
MILFDQIIFGPIHSRRLGLSLGVNLLPIDAKICSFNCIYCECGFNTTMHDSPIPTRDQVRETLDAKLHEMVAEGQIPDVITFAGNGEPTLHAEFEGIIDDTIALRNKYCPTAKVSVLSNSTRIHKPHIFAALNKVDNNILKFDSAIDRTMKLMDQPVGKHINVAWFIEHLKKFDGRLIIQTMFLRGEVQGEKLDNTTDEEVEAWIQALEQIRPQQVMMYSLDREAPTQNLQKVSVDELNIIAEKVRAKGFDVSVAG